jgi:hypothetical protein
LRLPATFIVTWGLPTGAELGYGFRKDWLSREDMVAVALAKYKAGVLLTSAEEQLALLLSDEFYRVDDLASDLEISDQPVEHRARYWLFLALAWLLEHRREYEDPLQTIEMLWTDFDYPNEIRNLIATLPAEPGEIPGIQGIERRWPDYVEQERLRYRERAHRRSDDW